MIHIAIYSIQKNLPIMPIKLGLGSIYDDERKVGGKKG